jgi:hypothetical protein
MAAWPITEEGGRRSTKCPARPSTIDFGEAAPQAARPHELWLTDVNAVLGPTLSEPGSEAQLARRPVQ